MDIVNLNEVQLLDFLKCPIIYDSVNNKKMLIHKNNIALNNLLSKVSNNFYLNLINGKVLSLDTIKNKWDNLCLNYNLSSQQCLEGVSLLIKLFRWASNERLIIADINSPYEYSIKDNNYLINFKGEISTIAINSNNVPYLLVTDFNNKNPKQTLLDIKIKYTLDCFAYWKITNQKLKIRVHHIKTNKDYFTDRNDIDFNRLEKTIKNVVFSIKNNIYYPRESVLCPSCEFVNFCRAWY